MLNTSLRFDKTLPISPLNLTDFIQKKCRQLTNELTAFSARYN